MTKNAHSMKSWIFFSLLSSITINDKEIRFSLLIIINLQKNKKGLISKQCLKKCDSNVKVRQNYWLSGYRNRNLLFCFCIVNNIYVSPSLKSINYKVIYLFIFTTSSLFSCNMKLQKIHLFRQKKVKISINNNYENFLSHNLKINNIN